MQEKITRWIYENYWGLPIAAKFGIKGLERGWGIGCRCPGRSIPFT